MHRRCVLLFISATLFSFSLFAQEEAGWLSLQRLSVSASGRYSYSPWNKLNQSLNVVTETISYDPVYVSPSGSAQKILGDLAGSISLNYRVYHGLTGLVMGEYTVTSSKLTFRDAQYDRDIGQNFDLRVFGFGIGAEYRAAVNELVECSPFFAILQNSATLKFSHRYNRTSGDTYRFDAQLRNTRIGFQTGVRVSVRVTGTVSVFSGIEYRFIKFPNLEGNCSYAFGNLSPILRSFDVYLAEGDGYFGIKAKQGEIYDPTILLRTLWQRVENPSSMEESIKPTSLNLSAVGVTLGARIAF